MSPTTSFSLSVILALFSIALIVFWPVHKSPRLRSALAHRRGLEYALAELYVAENKTDCIDRLGQEATEGLHVDGRESAFDQAILEVINAYLETRSGAGMVVQDSEDDLPSHFDSSLIPLAPTALGYPELPVPTDLESFQYARSKREATRL